MSEARLYHDIGAEELEELVATQQPVFLDMRDHDAYSKGHIEGAIPASEEHIRQLLRRREQPVVVYCYHGHSSRDLAEFLGRMGAIKVFNLSGGWHGLQSSSVKSVATVESGGHEPTENGAQQGESP